MNMKKNRLKIQINSYYYYYYIPG